jgi:hypothetical protein
VAVVVGGGEEGGGGGGGEGGVGGEGAEGREEAFEMREVDGLFIVENNLVNALCDCVVRTLSLEKKHETQSSTRTSAFY